MTIGEEAKKWFEDNEGPGAFSAALVRCFLFGAVIRRPDLVVLGEPVLTDGKRVVAISPGCFEPNCWWVWFWTARPNEFGFTCYDLQVETPYPLPYVGFRRRGKTRVYAWDRLRKDIHGRSTISSSTSAS